jgi:hypothetical protein
MAEERTEDERAERGARRALPTFNGKSASFPVWKARVRAWLQAESTSLLYVLDGSTGPLQQETQQQAAAASASSVSSSASVSAAGGKAAAAAKRREERQEQDRLRVYNALLSALDDTHVGIIVTEVAEGDAAGAWRILLRKYERNTAASRNQLRRELHTLRLAESETIDEYKSRGLHIAARLRATKEVVSDGEVLYCLLEGLPPAFDMVRQALEVQDIVELEAACGHLREVEDKIRRRAVGGKERTGGGLQGAKASGSSDEWTGGQLNKIEMRNGGAPCPICGRRGHTMFSCSRRHASGCFRCGARGHSVRDCRSPVEMSEAGVSVIHGEGSENEEEAQGRPSTPGRPNSNTIGW